MKVQKMYPADVRGSWRTRKNLLSILLMGVFLGLPWVRIGGNPAVLLDLGTRRFSLFGILFWAHDAPMLFLVFAGVALTIFFLTAVFGRAWCGWACPEPVFVEQIFRRIERWVEGDAVARRKLDDGPFSFEKFQKKSFKWGLFTLASLVIGHSFIAYFIGTERLGRMMSAAPSQNPETFFMMLASSGLVLFAFGWFREQFCIILCPYGRFQSVLMDPRSMLVSYDRARGEPRKVRGTTGPSGDCVDCGKCVQVCPTGIDIRNGTQMECVACTSCIDACDSVMARLKKPQGLIRYATESGLPVSALRARPLLYAGVWGAVVATLGWVVTSKEPLNVDLLRQGGAPYTAVSTPTGERWLNRFTLHLHSESFDDHFVEIRLAPAAAQAGVELRVLDHAGILPAGSRERAGVEVVFPKSAAPGGHGRVELEVVATPKGIRSGPAISQRLEAPRVLKKEVRLVGPLI